MDKKCVILGNLIILFFLLLVICGCVKDDLKINIEDKFYKEIECEDINDITLTIYYKDPLVLTRYPWDVNMLIANCDHKFVVDGNEFEKQSDSICKLFDAQLIPVNNPSSINARVYYVIESKKNGKLLDVAMWGGNDKETSIFVNGIEVEEVDIFYDVIEPFLPEELVEELQMFRVRESGEKNERCN